MPEPGPSDVPVEVKPADLPRKIAVAGEIPFAGLALVRALLQRGFSARVLCPAGDAELGVLAEKGRLMGATGGQELDIVRGEMGDAGALKALMEGAYGACCMSPVTLNGRVHRAATHLEDVRRFIDAAQNSAIRKLVYHSALGAQHRDSYSRALREAAAAEDLLQAAKCEDFAVRTGMLMGRGDGFLSQIVERGRAAGILTSIWGYGDTCVQPLHVDDLARCITRFYTEKPSEMQPGIYSLAGPEVTTLLDVIDSVAERLGKASLKFHVPLFVLKLLMAFRSRPSDAAFRERVKLLFDVFYTEKSDAPKLLGPGERLRTLRQTADEMLAPPPARSPN